MKRQTGRELNRFDNKKAQYKKHRWRWIHESHDNRNIVSVQPIVRSSSILSICQLIRSQLVLSERICARPFLMEKVVSSELHIS